MNFIKNINKSDLNKFVELDLVDQSEFDTLTDHLYNDFVVEGFSNIELWTEFDGVKTEFIIVHNDDISSEVIVTWYK